MAKKRPSNADRLVSHAIVGLGVGAITWKMKGLPGLVVGFFLGALAHEALDAPVAQVVAEIT